MLLEAFIDQAREICGAGPRAMMSVLQAMRDASEDAENHAYEKPLIEVQRPERGLACHRRKKSAGVHEGMQARP